MQHMLLLQWKISEQMKKTAFRAAT